MKDILPWSADWDSLAILFLFVPVVLLGVWLKQTRGALFGYLATGIGSAAIAELFILLRGSIDIGGILIMLVFFGCGMWAVHGDWPEIRFFR